MELVLLSTPHNAFLRLLPPSGRVRHVAVPPIHLSCPRLAIATAFASSQVQNHKHASLLATPPSGPTTVAHRKRRKRSSTNRSTVVDDCEPPSAASPTTPVLSTAALPRSTPESAARPQAHFPSSRSPPLRSSIAPLSFSMSMTYSPPHSTHPAAALSFGATCDNQRWQSNSSHYHLQFQVQPILRSNTHKTPRLVNHARSAMGLKTK